MQLYASQCVCSVSVVYFQIFDYQALFPCRIISACVIGGFVFPAGPSPLILNTAFYLTIAHKRHNGIQALIRPVLSLIFSLSFSLSLIISILCPPPLLPPSVNEGLRLEAPGGAERGSEWQWRLVGVAGVLGAFEDGSVRVVTAPPALYLYYSLWNFIITFFLHMLHLHSLWNITLWSVILQSSPLRYLYLNVIVNSKNSKNALLLHFRGQLFCALTWDWIEVLRTLDVPYVLCCYDGTSLHIPFAQLDLFCLEWNFRASRPLPSHC